MSFKRLLCFAFVFLLCTQSVCARAFDEDEDAIDPDTYIESDADTIEPAEEQAEDFYSRRLFDDDATPLYYARVSAKGASLFGEQNGDYRLLYLRARDRIPVYAVYPEFVLTKYLYNGSEVHGYVYRSRIDEVKPVDSVNTPPYGVDVYQFMTSAVQDTPILSAPTPDADVLITLHEGARFAIIGVENGWAKLVYHRQYGYVDTRLLDELVAVKSGVDEAEIDQPIAVFTSYYNIATTEKNINRMSNIAVACARMSALSFKPGETINFNKQVGPYKTSVGYKVAGALVDGGTGSSVGGGTCQVASTTYNVLLQLPGIYILHRRAHGENAAPYLPHGVDAAVGNSSLNLIFRNDYPFEIRIDASSQDGALFIAFWRVDEIKRIQHQKKPPVLLCIENGGSFDIRFSKISGGLP